MIRLSDVAKASTANGTVMPETKGGIGLRSNSLSSRLILLTGIGTLLFAAALTARTYIPCPFWDEWAFIYQIANGAGPSSWDWLWSQHNEHRLAMTRLLVYLDLSAFGGKNISLLLEMFLAQVLNWAAICVVLESLTEFPKPLKRTMQGLFAFCLFHPNQAQNLTWAFQVSFILCFAIGTSSLLAVAFFDRIPPRWRIVALPALAVAPMIAAVNLSAGLLLAPAVVVLAWLKRLLPRHIIALAIAYSLIFLAYLDGYSNPGGYSPIESLRHPLPLLAYILTYFDASWRFFLPPHYHIASVISLTALLLIAVRMIRNHEHVTKFGLFCLAQCGLILATAALTALGRLHLGIEQALAGRYQTPAMLYWACISSLALIWIWQRWPTALHIAQRTMLIMICLNLFLFLPYWKAWASTADARRHACTVVMSGRYGTSATEILYPRPDILKVGAAFLRKRWH